jgi:hypothetical protein
MTIAAGLQFDQGVLICADSQFSSPSLKFFDTKLSHHTVSHLGGENILYSILAMSGTDGYMQMAVTECQNALCELATRPPDDIHQDSIRAVLTKTMVDLHKTHLFKHPHYGYTGGPNISLIAAVWMKDWNATLYWTNETAVNEVPFADPCIFVGSGSEIARYVTKPLLNADEDLSLEQAILVATHALRTAKDADPNCGGRSEFAVLYDDGRYSGIESFDISTPESHSQTFEQILRDLFFVSGNIDDPSRKHILTIANAQLRRIRQEQKVDRGKRRKLEEALKRKAST